MTPTAVSSASSSAAPPDTSLVRRSSRQARPRTPRYSSHVSLSPRRAPRGCCRACSWPRSVKLATVESGPSRPSPTATLTRAVLADRSSRIERSFRRPSLPISDSFLFDAIGGSSWCVSRSRDWLRYRLRAGGGAWHVGCRSAESFPRSSTTVGLTGPRRSVSWSAEERGPWCPRPSNGQRFVLSHRLADSKRSASSRPSGRSHDPERRLRPARPYSGRSGATASRCASRPDGSRS